MVVILSTPLFSSLSSAASGILKFFAVFVLTVLGFFAGQLYENRSVIDEESLSD